MHILRTEYEIVDYKPQIFVFCREDGKRKIIEDKSLKPYFYVPYNERDKVKGLVYEDTPYRTIYGDMVAKVYVTYPKEVTLFKEQFSANYEADVLFPLRYLIDKVREFEPCNPQPMFIDIETDDSGRVPDPHTSPEEIIAITAFSRDVYTTFIYRSDISEGKGNKISWDTLHEIIYYRSEQDMLNGFLDYFENEEPDVITGWNFINFDLPYIINRMKRLGIDYTRLSPLGKVYIDEYREGNITVKGISVIDLMATYKNLTQPTQGLKGSYSLDAVSNEVLGEGKIGSGGNVKWLWKFHLDELIDYNTNDTRLCVEIDKKEQLIGFLNELRMLCHCQLEDCLTPTRLIDCYILKTYHDILVFPSKSHMVTEKYEGALVESYGGGIHKYVTAYDLKSLYPSIIVTAGLSPESMRDSAEENTIKLGKFYVRQDIKGYLPEIIKTLFGERNKYKKLRNSEEYQSDMYKFYDMRQSAMKILLNAIYGQTAYTGSRIYDPRVAETITWMGRQVISWSRDYINSLGIKVLYLDTDSCHVEFGIFDLELMEQVHKMINQSYDEFIKKYGITSHIFEMEMEKVYRKIFYSKEAKKRYAGHLIYKDGATVDTVDVWGFEIKRSDASALTKRVLKNVFDMVLQQDKSKEEVMRYIGDEIDKMRKGEFRFSDIGIPKGMSKPAHEYIKDYNEELPSWGQKGVTANIRGALYSLDELKLELSNKPKMLYIEKIANGHPEIDVICFDEDKQVPAGTIVDVEKMLDKTVRAKLDPIFTGLGWNISELDPWWKGKAPKKGYQETLFEMPDI